MSIHNSLSPQDKVKHVQPNKINQSKNNHLSRVPATSTKISSSNSHSTEKKKKITNWVKRFMQPTASSHSNNSKINNKDIYYYKKIDREKDLKTALIETSSTKRKTAKKLTNRREPINSSSTGSFFLDDNSDDYCSDAFSIQGMISLKQTKVGKPQGMGINKLDVLSDQDIAFIKKHIIHKNTIADKELLSDKWNPDSKVSFATISAKSNSVFSNTNFISHSESYSIISDADIWDDSGVDAASGISVDRTERGSIFSDGLPSLVGQQTINSSLMGIPPQSIIESSRFNNNASNNSYRLPATSMSIASQSVKNYKPFSRNNNMNNNDHHACASIFSGVGTTTSHYNYYYNNSCESESNTTKEFDDNEDLVNQLSSNSISSSSASKHTPEKNDTLALINSSNSLNNNILSDFLPENN